MIKFTFIAASLILSLNAFADESDVSIFSSNDVIQLGSKKLHSCLKKGWEGASPTEDQTTKAKALIQTAKDMLESKKDAITKDKQAVMDAWSASQISSEAVESAQTTLRNTMIPVHKAFQDAKISALNLLSPDQKTAFNSSFKSCNDSELEQERGEKEE